MVDSLTQYEEIVQSTDHVYVPDEDCNGVIKSVLNQDEDLLLLTMPHTNEEQKEEVVAKIGSEQMQVVMPTI